MAEKALSFGYAGNFQTSPNPLQKNPVVLYWILCKTGAARGRAPPSGRYIEGKVRFCAMDTIKLDSGRAKMIAHRGLSGLEQENTCAAFVAAGNRAKYFGIETDVHKTADGRFVVFHDDDTARVGLDRLVVEHTTLQTLRALQLTDLDGARGRADLVIPTLEEYIGICKRYEKVCVCELKNEFAPEDVYRIAETYRELDYLDRVVFISFCAANLTALRRRFPSVPAQFLLQEWSPDDLAFLRDNNLGLDIRHTAVTAGVVEAVHGIGQEVNCWTVNTLEEAGAVLAAGVDYITTNILE